MLLMDDLLVGRATRFLTVLFAAKRHAPGF